MPKWKPASAGNLNQDGDRHRASCPEPVPFLFPLLLMLLAWASARFYYFLFYVLEHYVDPGLKYAGILALLRQIRRGKGENDRPE